METECAVHPMPPSPTLEEAEVGRAWTTKKMGQFRFQLPDLKMRDWSTGSERVPFSILSRVPCYSRFITISSSDPR